MGEHITLDNVMRVIYMHYSESVFPKIYCERHSGVNTGYTHKSIYQISWATILLSFSYLAESSPKHYLN